MPVALSELQDESEDLKSMLTLCQTHVVMCMIFLSDKSVDESFDHQAEPQGRNVVSLNDIIKV